MSPLLRRELYTFALGAVGPFFYGARWIVHDVTYRANLSTNGVGCATGTLGAVLLIGFVAPVSGILLVCLASTAKQSWMMASATRNKCQVQNGLEQLD